MTMMLEKFVEDLKYAVSFYALVYVIPIFFSILNIFFVGILGIESKYGFWMNFKFIWVGFIYDGTLLNIVAWRWHLFFLAFSFFYTKIDRVK